MTADIQAVCCECRHELPDPSASGPCPNCGATRRLVLVGLAGTLSFETELAVKQSQPGWSRFLRTLVSRHKISKSGRPAREVLDIDHTDPIMTVKRHHVEEVAEDGWKVAHDETECYPAKHRPPAP